MTAEEKQALIWRIGKAVEQLLPEGTAYVLVVPGTEGTCTMSSLSRADQVKVMRRVAEDISALVPGAEQENPSANVLSFAKKPSPPDGGGLH